MTVQLAAALALRAGLGDRQEAVASPDLAASGAHVARLGPAAGLHPRALARGARLEARDLDLRLDAGGGVFERELQLVLEVVTARGARAAPAAAAGEEVLEDVLEQGAEPRLAEPGTGAWRGRAEAVEVGALVGVGEDGVGLAELLEAALGVLVPRVAVRMVLHRELAVGLLDLRVAGAARDAEDLVVVARH